MSSTSTTTAELASTEHKLASLNLRPSEPAQEKQEEYKYEHLRPVFVQAHYPPLTPFEHSDPGHRALKHPNPRAFLDAATSVVELTPDLGTEVHGIDLASLDSDARDELALEVRSLCIVSTFD